MGVCTKERKGVTAEVLRATPCTNSLGGESGGQKHEGGGGRSACWKFAAVSERKVGFTKPWNTAMRHRRVGGRAVTVTAMLHRQKDRKKKKTREICIYI